MNIFNKKSVLISGANRGIGKAFVEELINLDVRKIYAGSRNPESLKSIVALQPSKVVPVKLDITNTESVVSATQQCQDIEILINNAGIAEFQGFLSAPDLQAARMEMETNYFGTMAMIRAFAPVLQKQTESMIINLASIASLVNFPMLGSYSASKAAVHSLTQSIRYELADQNTKVYGVYPGPVDTDMTKNVPMDKTSPGQVAKNIFAKVNLGIEDIYPDPTSTNMYEAMQKDYKKTEREAGAMLP